MVIVEGPDGSGKTTLVRHLAETLNLPVADKIVSSDLTVLANKKKWVDDNLDMGIQPMLFDRHCLISEGIYGPLLKGTLDDEFKDYQWYAGSQRMFRALQPLVIFCLPPLDVVRANVAADAVNPAIIKDQLEPIYWAYYHVAAGWLDSVTWDYSKGFDGRIHNIILDRVVVRVETYLNRRKLWTD